MDKNLCFVFLSPTKNINHFLKSYTWKHRLMAFVACFSFASSPFYVGKADSLKEFMCVEMTRCQKVSQYLL